MSYRASASAPDGTESVPEQERQETGWVRAKAWPPEECAECEEELWSYLIRNANREAVADDFKF
jgi:hypothetical protein